MARLAPVFVSHSQRDEEWCRTFVHALGLIGADVWADRHDSRYHQIVDVAERELRARPIFVAVLSPAAVLSPPGRRPTWKHSARR